MNLDDSFEQILASLHRAARDDDHWSTTSALIDEACGLRGNFLVIGEGDGCDVHIAHAKLCYRGEERLDLMKEYFQIYHP
ncbi:MAG: hypothetical protein OXC42_03920, partial [Gammaproteobacteria bacterium]|nr:hypothetical protein [Gammaproteobacteria bacterium]